MNGCNSVDRITHIACNAAHVYHSVANQFITIDFTPIGFIVLEFEEVHLNERVDKLLIQILDDLEDFRRNNSLKQVDIPPFKCFGQNRMVSISKALSGFFGSLFKRISMIFQEPDVLNTCQDRMCIIHLENVVVLKVVKSAMFCQMSIHELLHCSTRKEILLAYTKHLALGFGIVGIQEVGDIGYSFTRNSFNRIRLPESKRENILVKTSPTFVIADNRQNIGNSLYLSILKIHDYSLVGIGFKPRITVTHPVVFFLNLIESVELLLKQAILVINTKSENRITSCSCRLHKARSKSAQTTIA